MQLDMINKLYLELSQVATAKTAREIELENLLARYQAVEANNTELVDLLTSARAIAHREGKDTHWARFEQRLDKAGIGHVTPKTFRILPGDESPRGMS